MALTVLGQRHVRSMYRTLTHSAAEDQSPHSHPAPARFVSSMLGKSLIEPPLLYNGTGDAHHGPDHLPNFLPVEYVFTGKE